MSTVPVSVARPFCPFLAIISGRLAPFAEPLVRVAAGLLLMPHGAQKLFGFFNGYGVEGTGRFFAEKLGLPPALAVLAGLIEFFGGLCLALGLLTRPVAALVVGLMAVAILRVHLANGFFWTDGGFEYPALWGVVALSFVIRGGGAFSLDAMIGREF